jgi:hypothetical protein
MPSSTLNRPRTRANPADWVVLVPGQPPADQADAVALTSPAAASPSTRHTRPAFAPSAFLPTRVPPIVGAVASRLLLLLCLTTAALTALVMVTGQDPLLTLGFKTPHFVAYQGASAEGIRFTLNDGWTQTAAVPGALLMDWHEGQAEPALRLTMGNPAAVPQVEQYGADGTSISEIRYIGTWEGVDTVLKSMPGGFSSNMIVAPGVDPGVIEMEYVGATALSIDNAGRLRVETPAGTWIDGTPETWQDGPAGCEAVESHFELRGGNRFGFTVGSYDPSRPLTVDPPTTRGF